MSLAVYLQIDTIKGECTDADHKEWIELFSYSHGLSNQISGSVSAAGAKAAGKADHQPFQFTKRMDKASTPIYKQLCEGKHFDKAVVEVCRATGKHEWIMKYTFEKVVMAHTGVGCSQGQEILMEDMSFQYSKIKWEYRPFDDKGGPGGVVPTEWDLSTNRGA